MREEGKEGEDTYKGINLEKKTHSYVQEQINKVHIETWWLRDDKEKIGLFKTRLKRLWTANNLCHVDGMNTEQITVCPFSRSMPVFMQF